MEIKSNFHKDIEVEDSKYGQKKAAATESSPNSRRLISAPCPGSPTSSPRSWPLRLVVVLVLAMVVVAVSAARVAPCHGAGAVGEGKGCGGHMLVARLPAGSSSRGPGHRD